MAFLTLKPAYGNGKTVCLVAEQRFTDEMCDANEAE